MALAKDRHVCILSLLKLKACLGLDFLAVLGNERAVIADNGDGYR